MNFCQNVAFLVAYPFTVLPPFASEWILCGSYVEPSNECHSFYNCIVAMTSYISSDIGQRIYIYVGTYIHTYTKNKVFQLINGIQIRLHLLNERKIQPLTSPSDFAPSIENIPKLYGNVKDFTMNERRQNRVVAGKGFGSRTFSSLIKLSMTFVCHWKAIFKSLLLLQHH